MLQGGLIPNAVKHFIRVHGRGISDNVCINRERGHGYYLNYFRVPQAMLAKLFVIVFGKTLRVMGAFEGKFNDGSKFFFGEAIYIPNQSLKEFG